jgi:hypothetical protein
MHGKMKTTTTMKTESLSAALSDASPSFYVSRFILSMQLCILCSRTHIYLLFLHASTLDLWIIHNAHLIPGCFSAVHHHDQLQSGGK